MTIKIDLQKLMEGGAHFGHQTKRWNPKMESYLYGEENGVHIFDLFKTKEALEEVFELLSKAGKEGKKIMFIGTKKQSKDAIKEVGIQTGQYWVSERWLGGILTNIDQIKKTLRNLEDKIAKRASGEYKAYTKREQLLIDREIERTERFFGGLKGLDEMPEYFIVVDTRREKGAISEANKKGVKTIAIVDSNCDPYEVDYPIPMNDDATKAIAYVLEMLGQAYMDGAKKSTAKK